MNRNIYQQEWPIEIPEREEFTTNISVCENTRDCVIDMRHNRHPLEQDVHLQRRISGYMFDGYPPEDLLNSIQVQMKFQLRRYGRPDVDAMRRL